MMVVKLEKFFEKEKVMVPTNERVMEILRTRLQEEGRQLRLLIIDDGDKRVDRQKGYDQIETLWPGMFEIDRAYSWNAENCSPAALPLLTQKTYDLILLDQNFEWQPHQGYEILYEIRNADFNSKVYVIGVSTEWDQYAGLRIRPNTWTKREECDPPGLVEKMNQFFREGALFRPPIKCSAGNLLELEHHIYHTCGKLPRHCCNDIEYPEFAQRCPVVCPPRDTLFEVWDPIKSLDGGMFLRRGGRFTAGYLKYLNGYSYRVDILLEGGLVIGQLYLQRLNMHVDLRGVRPVPQT